MASVETMVSVMCFPLIHSNTSLYSYFSVGIRSKMFSSSFSSSSSLACLAAHNTNERNEKILCFYETNRISEERKLKKVAAAAVAAIQNIAWNTRNRIAAPTTKDL